MTTYLIVATHDYVQGIGIFRDDDFWCSNEIIDTFHDVVHVTAKCVIILLSIYSSKCVIACSVFNESYAHIMQCDLATCTAAYLLLTGQFVVTPVEKTTAG